MTLYPRHRLSRIAAVLWLLVCLACLLITLLKPDLHGDDRSALKTLVPVYFLGFPSTQFAVVAMSKIKLATYLNAGFTPSVFSEGVALWVLMITLGYLQWFIVLPWISRLCWRMCHAPLARDAAAKHVKSPD